MKNKINYKKKNKMNLDKNGQEVLSTQPQAKNLRIIKPFIIKEFGKHKVVCYSLQVLMNNNRLCCSERKAQHILNSQGENFNNLVGYFENTKSFKRFFVRADCINEFNEKLQTKNCKFPEKKHLGILDNI